MGASSQTLLNLCFAVETARQEDKKRHNFNNIDLLETAIQYYMSASTLQIKGILSSNKTQV